MQTMKLSRLQTVAVIIGVAATGIVGTNVAADARPALSCPRPYKPTKLTIGKHQALVCATPLPATTPRPTPRPTVPTGMVTIAR